MPNEVIYNKETPITRTATVIQHAWYYGSSYFWSGPILYGEVKANRTPRTTPNFRADRKAGKRLRPLPYFISETFNSVNYGFLDYRDKDGVVALTSLGVQSEPLGELALSSSTPLVNTAHALNIQKLLNKVKDSKFNGVVALAEASQLQRLVGGTAVTLARTLGHLRRGQLQAAGNTLGLTFGKRQVGRFTRDHKEIKSQADIDKLMSTGVLAVQYGIRPLIQDVIGAAELYAQKRCEEVVNKVTAVTKTKVSERRMAIGEFSQGTVTRVGTLTGNITVTRGATFAKGSEVVHTLKQLGLTNPFELAWEALPWSFVIDWFIPFGNYLSSIDATLGLDFKDGYISVKIDLSTNWDQTYAPHGGVQNLRHTGLSQRVKYERSFSRSLMTEWPSPAFPPFKNPLSWEHALNGIALLAQFKKTVYR